MSAAAPLIGTKCDRCRATFLGMWCPCLPRDVVAIARAVLPRLGGAPLLAIDLASAILATFQDPDAAAAPLTTICEVVGHRVANAATYVGWERVAEADHAAIVDLAFEAWRIEVQQWSNPEPMLFSEVVVLAYIYRRAASLDTAPSIKTIATDTGLKVGVVEDAIASLQRLGVIAPKRGEA